MKKDRIISRSYDNIIFDKEIRKKIKTGIEITRKEFLNKKEYIVNKNISAKDISGIRKNLAFWAGKKRISRFDPGEQSSINKVISEQNYLFEISVLFVKRSLNSGMRVYRGEDVSAEYVPVSLHVLPYRAPPRGFEEGKESEKIVPGSERIMNCRVCSGKIKKIRRRTRHCPACEGTGKTVTYECYRTVYSPQCFKGILSPLKLKDKDITKIDGDNIFRGTVYNRLKNPDSMVLDAIKPDYIKSYIEKIYDRINDPAADKGWKIFRMDISLRRIIMKKVEFIYRKKSYCLRITGENGSVYNNKSLFYRSRLVFVFAGLLVIMIIGIKNIHISKAGKTGTGVVEIPRVMNIAAKAVEEEKTIQVPVNKKLKITREPSKNNRIAVRRKQLYDNGVLLLKEGVIETAYNCFKTALELNMDKENNSGFDPTDAQLYFYIGETMMGFENYDEAISAYEKVIKDAPSNNKARERLKNARILKNMYERK
ncbi:MAG: hypothetical protein ABIH89_06440 [Elusimicrobiota bacterium]